MIGDYESNHMSRQRRIDKSPPEALIVTQIREQIIAASREYVVLGRDIVISISREWLGTMTVHRQVHTS